MHQYAVFTAYQYNRRRDEHNTVFRTVYRRYSDDFHCACGRPAEGCAVRYIHNHSSADRRQHNRREDTRKHDRYERILGHVLVAAVRRYVRICRYDDRRSAVFGHLLSRNGACQRKSRKERA